MNRPNIERKNRDGSDKREKGGNGIVKLGCKAQFRGKRGIERENKLEES